MIPFIARFFGTPKTPFSPPTVDKKIKNIFYAVVILAVVFAIYQVVKKDKNEAADQKEATESTYTPPNANGTETNETLEKRLKGIAYAMYDDMDGVNTSNDVNIYIKFNALNDRNFVQVYNYFNKIPDVVKRMKGGWFSDGDGGLRTWINDEGLSGEFEGIVKALNARFDRLGLKM